MRQVEWVFMKWKINISTWIKQNEIGYNHENSGQCYVQKMKIIQLYIVQNKILYDDFTYYLNIKSIKKYWKSI